MIPTPSSAAMQAHPTEHRHHAAIAAWLRRLRRRAIAVSAGLHCAALLALTLPLWKDAAGEFARSWLADEAERSTPSAEHAQPAAPEEEIEGQAQHPAAQRILVRLVYRAPEVALIPPGAGTPEPTPGSEPASAFQPTPDPEPASDSEPASVSAEVAQVAALDGAQDKAAEVAEAPAPGEVAELAARPASGEAAQTAALAGVADGSGLSEGARVVASAKVSAVAALEQQVGPVPEQRPASSDGSASASPPAVKEAGGAAQAPASGEVTAGAKDLMQLARGNLSVQPAEAGASGSTAATGVTAFPVTPDAAEPRSLPTVPEKVDASSAADRKPGPEVPLREQPSAAKAPGTDTLPVSQVQGRPTDTAPQPARAQRQQRMAEELQELAERIKAYQAREEKARREAALAQRWTPEGEGVSSAPASAKVAPPESASTESIAQARLAVALTPFQTAHRYRMYYGDRSDDTVVALVRLEVEVDGEIYRMRSEARPQGLAAALFQGVFTQESRGRISPWGYRPEQYEEQRGNRGTRWAQMDWAAGEVRLPDGERQPIAPGVQDRLSIAWQLSALAQHQRARLQSSEGIQIPLLLSRHVELNRFYGREVSEQELDGQRLKLLKVEREPRKGKRDARIEVWLDTERDMLPVRMRIADDRGRVIDQVIVLNAS